MCAIQVDPWGWWHTSVFEGGQSIVKRAGFSLHVTPSTAVASGVVSTRVCGAFAEPSLTGTACSSPVDRGWEHETSCAAEQSSIVLRGAAVKIYLCKGVLGCVAARPLCCAAMIGFQTLRFQTLGGCVWKRHWALQSLLGIAPPRCMWLQVPATRPHFSRLLCKTFCWEPLSVDLCRGALRVGYRRSAIATCCLVVGGLRCQRLGVLAAVALAAWGVVKIVALCVWGCPGVFAPCLNSAQLRAAELRGVRLTAPVDCTALSAQA